MNNLQYIKATAWETFTWSLGKNNLDAIGEVIEGYYEYNHERLPSRMLQIKQVGTELVHIGLKYRAMVYLASTGLSKLAGRQITMESATNAMFLASTISSYAPGAIAIWYAGKHVYDNVTEGSKQLKAGSYQDAASKYYGALSCFVNAVLIVPVGLYAYYNGAYAGTLATAGLFAANKIVDLQLLVRQGKLGPVALKAALVAGMYYTTFGNPFASNPANQTGA
jgi:hypothetical protein